MRILITMRAPRGSNLVPRLPGTTGSVAYCYIRTLYIESDDEIVARIHKVLEHIDPERVYLSTDCGLKALPRFCAYEKLRALSRAAARVRAEIGNA